GGPLVGAGAARPRGRLRAVARTADRRRLSALPPAVPASAGAPVGLRALCRPDPCRSDARPPLRGAGVCAPGSPRASDAIGELASAACPPSCSPEGGNTMTMTDTPRSAEDADRLARQPRDRA